VELADRVLEVQNREQLAAFVTALRVDLATQPDDWTNADLDSFLEALSAWLADAPAYYQNTGQLPPDSAWRVLADALAAARIYE